MRLANSNGGNKGKKYIRLTGDEEITPDRTKEVLRFTKWFNDNCRDINDSIKTKEEIDPEVFADTYLSMYDAIAFKRLNTKDYKAYFCRAYYTNKIATQARELKRDSRHYDLDSTWNIPDEDKYNEDTVKEAEQLNNDILGYVRISYAPIEYSLFEIYVHAKPAMSYKELSKLTKIPYYRIAASLSAILKDVREVFRECKESIIG